METCFRRYLGSAAGVKELGGCGFRRRCQHRGEGWLHGRTHGPLGFGGGPIRIEESLGRLSGSGGGPGRWLLDRPGLAGVEELGVYRVSWRISHGKRLPSAVNCQGCSWVPAIVASLRVWGAIRCGVCALTTALAAARARSKRVYEAVISILCRPSSKGRSYRKALGSNLGRKGRSSDVLESSGA